MKYITRIVIAISTMLLASPTFAQPVTSKESFTPVDNDIALTNLRKFAGCAVDSLWKSSGTCTDDRPITIALTYFNVLLLIVGTIFITYTTFKSIFDTANDGRAFGSSIDGRSTMLRIGAGAIMALPIKSGFSVIQIIVIQIAIFGSGAGDTLWNKVAGKSLAGMYGSLPPMSVQSGDLKLRGTLAKALQGRIYGYICKIELENYSNLLSNSVKPVSPATKSTPDFANNGTATTYYFKADPYYRSSGSACGSTTYSYANIDPIVTDADGANARMLMNASQTIGQQAFDKAFQSIDASAQTIASDITSAPRNEENVKSSIKDALNNATSAVSTTLASLSSSQNPDMQSMLTQYLNASTQNGWLSAVLWQRSMTTVYAKMSSIVDNATLDVSAPPDITGYIPLTSRFGGTYNALVDQATRDMEYFKGFDGYFTSLSSPLATGIASDSASTELNAKQNTWAAWLVSGIYQGILKIISQPESSTWRDPILDTQEIGNTIAYYDMYLLGVGGAGSAASFFDKTGTLEKISGFLLAIAYLLLFCAFTLSGIAPFLVLVNFFFASLHWFVSIAEALIAVPIWVLTKFMPSTQSSLVGSSSRGYYFFLSILLRPPLIIVGFLAAILLMRIGIDIANMLFRGSLALLSPDGAISMLMIATAGIAVYASVLFMLIAFCSSLISSIPDHVLGWIDSQVSGNKASSTLAQFSAGALPTAIAGRGISASAGRAVAGTAGAAARLPGQATTALSGLRNKLSGPSGSAKGG